MIIIFLRELLKMLIYLTFTNTLNYLYENQKPITKSIIKVSHFVLSQFPYLKNLFIKAGYGEN